MIELTGIKKKIANKEIESLSKLLNIKENTKEHFIIENVIEEVVEIAYNVGRDEKEKEMHEAISENK